MAPATSNRNTSIGTATLLIGGGYLVLVRVLRYRRQEANKQLFLQNPRDPEIARQIHVTLATHEFPLVYRKALEFALFRTFAIPTISKLLVKTGDLQKHTGKRYDDTDLLLSEMIQCPFDSERSKTAIQRINAIHNQYAAHISNDDMLYVLSVFTLEPLRWIERVEWRKPSAEEHQATYLTWKYMESNWGFEIYHSH